MKPTMVCFDFETTNLRANFGRLLVASFISLNSDEVVTFRADEEKYKKKNLSNDSSLAKDIKKYMEDQFCWISWNGKLFDMPFLNTRLRLADLEPVNKRIHIDLMYYARRPNLCLNSSRLDTVAKTFRLGEQKTDLDPQTWVDAMLLDKKALDYVAEHCEQDVRVLKEAFQILSPFIKNMHM